MLTVFVDLNVAIAVGVVMASVLFVHRMAEANGATMRAHSDDEEGLLGRLNLPASVRLYQMRGPMFFGAAERIARALEGVSPYPRVIILDMAEVPLVDATAIAALEDLAKSSDKHGCQLFMSALDGQPRRALHTYGFLRAHKVVLAATAIWRSRRRGRQ